jgi:hypothetical protein
LGKKARNAESVNANYKIHDENTQLFGYQKAEGGRFVEALKRSAYIETMA